MVDNRVELDIAIADAIADMEGAEQAMDDGAVDAVKQLAVLAEGAMKKEAPEGAGRDRHLRDSIDTRFARGGKRANVGPRKRVDGVLLAHYVVEGTDASSYDIENPPPPLFDWADAKLGDPSLGWAVSMSIAQDGHDTLPNPFVDRSAREWNSQVEDVTNEAVADALNRLMRG